MEILKTLFFKKKLKRLEEEITAALSQASSSSQLPGAVEEKIKNHFSISPRTTVEFVLNHSLENTPLPRLVAQLAKEQSEKGEKILKDALFHPKYKNRPPLAHFVEPFFSFGRQRLRQELFQLYAFHNQSEEIRAKILALLLQTNQKQELGPIFQLLHQTPSEQALEVFFAFIQEVPADKLKDHSASLQALCASASASRVGYLLEGYRKNFLPLVKKACGEQTPQEEVISILLALSLRLQGEDLYRYYSQIFAKHPATLVPFYELARDKSVFTPRDDRLELAKIQQNRSIQLVYGAESVAKYRPEFTRFLIENIPNFSTYPLPLSIQLVQILGELKALAAVPPLMELYRRAESLQPAIVQALPKIQTGDRLIEILEHFKKRTKNQITRENINKIIEQTKKEKYL
ncbi:MAG: hypothetical protein D6805_09645 [Planctomycetota bacterium]|nr:MAG: hypothetical protein D6805_09645 [Planctomycetota bacterium]